VGHVEAAQLRTVPEKTVESVVHKARDRRHVQRLQRRQLQGNWCASSTHALLRPGGRASGSGCTGQIAEVRIESRGAHVQYLQLLARGEDVFPCQAYINKSGARKEKLIASKRYS
jgi:hypothetical protein